LSGIVTRYFDEHDKVRFVEKWCVQNGFSMSRFDSALELLARVVAAR
jgi:hypothetical protein